MAHESDEWELKDCLESHLFYLHVQCVLKYKDFVYVWCFTVNPSIYVNGGGGGMVEWTGGMPETYCTYSLPQM